jgi:hypothetical protein
VTALAWLLAAVLACLALLHAYWGFGGRWPGHDDASLVGYVVGRTRGMRAPSPLACAAVAFALAGAATLAAARTQGRVTQGVALGLCTAATVFLLRGAAGFFHAPFRTAAGTKFYRLNRIFYSPLCLAIGVGLGAVAVF